MRPNPAQAAAALAQPAYQGKLIATILVTSVCYLSLLSFVNARGVNVSPALVGFAEALIYAACLSVVCRKLSLPAVALSSCIGAWMLFAWVIRQSPDIKSLRDLIVPLLFVSLGRHVADVGFADRCMKLIVGVVVAVALFEVAFIDTYATLFNSFSFYKSIAGVVDEAASFQGQMLSLNGYRPEGIGRTILPMLLGSHRASSVFMEPIALGNFAVIVLAWGLSKPWSEIRQASLYMLAAALIITLCDSRFGLLLGVVFVAVRGMPLAVVGRLAPTFPFLILAVLIAFAWFAPSLGDNLHGRITTSGMALLQLKPAMLMGLGSPLPAYGDMGYAYLLSRFGALLAILLIAVIFLIPMADQRGQRFRQLIVLYIFSSLAISGTSVFALKTAALMWFLFGVLSSATADARLRNAAVPMAGAARPRAKESPA
jgi:putative polymerase